MKILLFLAIAAISTACRQPPRVVAYIDGTMPPVGITLTNRF